MPLMPIHIAGKVRMVALPAEATSKDIAQTEEENVRRASIWKRRLYYEGAQYDETNLETYAAQNVDPLTDRIPEHDRLHAYSSQIQESIDFLADQIAEAFSLSAEAPEVEDLILDSLKASDQFTGDSEDDQVQVENALRDAMISGDVAVEIKYDPIERVPYYEVWEGEQVRFDYRNRRLLEKVVREEIIWVASTEGEQQVVERVEYEVLLNSDLSFDEGEPVMDCRKATFHDDQDEPVKVEWLGLPFIPWVLVRADQKNLRATRGESLITEQVMDHADRFNANEQLAYVIARYNSHGNLAVIGDAANLEGRQEKRIAKDVADVLTFPGGTALQTITLPTDPQMIEHQRGVLAEAMYQSFGLTRLDNETLFNVGAVSGYALEILNRKTEGTFRRVRRHFRRGLHEMFDMALDVAAYRSAVPDVDLDDDGDGMLSDIAAPGLGRWWDVDPHEVYSKRQIEIRLGSGYVVDDALIREDFVAGLISRREALRRRGLSDPDIDDIVAEVEDEKPADPGEIGRFAPSSGAGSTVGNASR